MYNYKYVIYNKGSFCGGSNVDLNLITCEDKIIIPEILQSYVLHWYHTYLLHPGLYCPRIRDAVRKEVTNCDTFQCTKRSNKKYGKLPAKEAEENYLVN